MNNSLDLLQVSGVAKIMERVDMPWLGVLLPAITLVISILAVWAVYNYYNKKQ
jgi:hypothetical protein